ncbi:MAG: hypothetical protein V1646_00285 [bacterium]
MSQFLKCLLKYFLYFVTGFAILTVGFAAYLIWFQPPFYFPKPTGQYTVGTKLFELTDPTRNDPETNKPRELVAQVWFPSKGRPGIATAPYAYEALQVLKKGCSTEKQKRMLDLIRTNAISDASVSSELASCPIVIFGHGYGMARGLYSFLCEEIASHGYVVAMVMHTYVTPLTRFFDGREFGSSQRKKDIALCEECFADIEFMLNKAMAGNFGEALTSICDFNNIGIIGHSLGGIMSSQICRRDERVKAGISLDGALLGIDGTKTFHKPFMFIRTSDFYESHSEDLLQTMGADPRSFKGSIEQFCRENGEDTIQIVVRGAQHNTFSDFPILLNFLTKIFGQSEALSLLPDTGHVSSKALETMRNSVIIFFNRYLKGLHVPYPSSIKHDSDHENFDFYIP